MLMQQCTFKNGNTYTQGWVDAKKIKGKTRCTLPELKEGWWEITSKGVKKEKKDIEITFKNNI